MRHIPVLELDEGPVRVPSNAINNLLVRLHNAWKKGNIRWIRGHMTDNKGGYCMLGGIEHISQEVAMEEGLNHEQRMKLVRDANQAIAKTIQGVERDVHDPTSVIINTNDGTWRDIARPLETIRKAIQKANA